MATATFIWVEGKDPTSVWMPGYQTYITHLFQLVEDVLEKRREEIENWMKENHVWRNRTQLAQDSLFSKVVYDNLRFILIMGHGRNVPYSRFLERYMQQGRFSVLRPALDYWSPVLLEDLRRAMR